MQRRAFVTGSSSGIGAAVAARLLSEGWHVHGLDRAPATIQHAEFTAHAVDLSDFTGRAAGKARAERSNESANEVVSGLLAAGPVQALVHAAGLLRTAPLGHLQPDEGAQMWQVHVEAATYVANAVLPAMAHAGHGRMVLIGSRISRGMPGRSQYAATKAALASLARSWAAEVVGRGVTVNVISPAATDTPMLKDPARASSAPLLTPMGRLIQPGDVAALVSFLLGPEAAAITGQDIAVCGGASLPR